MSKVGLHPAQFPFNLSSHHLIVRKSLRPRFKSSQLTSARILAERSAVPAVPTRQTSSSSLKRKKITSEEKERLLRIGKKMRKGPFNAVMDPTEVGAGSALLELSEAAKKSGEYDVWAEGDNDADDEQDEEVIPKKAAPKVSADATILVTYLPWMALTEARSPSSSQTYCSTRGPLTTRRHLLQPSCRIPYVFVTRSSRS